MIQTKKQSFRRFAFLAFKVVTVITAILAGILNLYIYNYFRLSTRCSWKHTSSPIRLLAFGDPQIRGASSSSSLRTRLDIWGNDYYLAHIFKTLALSLQPTHVGVMGDLISSQWISDGEFYERGERYAKRIFRQELLLRNAQFFNICGNHDVGYAGEMTHERMNRYEKIYGLVNFAVASEGYRIIVLNSLALDGPGWEQEYGKNTLEFLNQLRNQNFEGPTILLTHVPLYKESGVCADPPLFNYYGPEFRGVLREQNQLSKESTQIVLESLFNSNYGGVILTGHDHEGCLAEYEFQNASWKLIPSKSGYGLTEKEVAGPNILEATVRSMMGEFGGNTGLLSGFRNEANEWTFSYQLCPFSVQHLWWVTQVVSVIAPVMLAALLLR